MQRIVIATPIVAPRERCFDLARDIDAHVATAKETRERAVGERQHGLLGFGDVVTWQARHFGITGR